MLCSNTFHCYQCTCCVATAHKGISSEHILERDIDNRKIELTKNLTQGNQKLRDKPMGIFESKEVDTDLFVPIKQTKSHKTIKYL